MNANFWTRSGRWGAERLLRAGEQVDLRGHDEVVLVQSLDLVSL
jgi:hypothetical protein